MPSTGLPIRTAPSGRTGANVAATVASVGPYTLTRSQREAHIRAIDGDSASPPAKTSRTDVSCCASRVASTDGVAMNTVIRCVTSHSVNSVPAVIPAVPFVEALRIAGAPPSEPDLAPAHERALGEWAVREHGSEFLFVTGYPMVKRPFYTHPDPGRPRFSRSFDLLFRGLELITGGQRLHRYEDYLAALAARGEDPADYDGYLQVFRFGMPPHGGFAIGLERWVARLTGAANIRETTLFPRDLTRLSP